MMKIMKLVCFIMLSVSRPTARCHVTFWPRAGGGVCGSEVML